MTVPSHTAHAFQPDNSFAQIGDKQPGPSQFRLLQVQISRCHAAVSSSVMGANIVDMKQRLLNLCHGMDHSASGNCN